MTTLPLPLPSQPPGSFAASESQPSCPVVLSVGTIEGRKNHLSLLLACEHLWNQGVQFQLELAGLAHPETGRAAMAKIGELQAGGRPVRFHGPVSDAVLEGLYRRCTFTVYPSVMEGFGLPVLESLARRKPCICSGSGALGESARGGGCVTLARMDPDSLAGALRQLLSDGSLFERLAHEAGARTFRTWSDYGDDLLAWLRCVKRRSD